MKDYCVNVTIKFTNVIGAESKKEAKQIVKEIFLEDYNIELANKEIESVEEI